ncbi:MAG: tetratricopeptide repeat protein [Vicinamibacterales bacterium]
MIRSVEFVTIDRAAALRNAEKLLRQGRLDQAIEEYSRVVDDDPTDWNTRNTLGDLLVRAGQLERAVAEFTRIADAFRDDGFYPKAAALYRKILKISADDEHATLQGAEVAAAQGLLADARRALKLIVERRLASGDYSGASTLAARLAALDQAAPASRVRNAQEPPVVDADRAVDRVEDTQAVKPEPVVSRPTVPVVAPAPELPTVAHTSHRLPNTEVDLSVVLDQIHEPQRAEPAAAPDLDDVFAQMRDEARRRLAIQAAEQDYRRGLDLFRAGQVEESIAALESASLMPRFRFEAASLLGKIFVNRGDLAKAISWLDRAVEAPASSPGAMHTVLYELADALESTGDAVRALAVSLELQALAGGFRDVNDRVRRLSTAQVRG